jgi:membrane protein YdbS with pleckstrin-like domain
MSAKHLGPDERVVMRMRTHAKALILPALALILVGGAFGVGAAVIPSDYRPGGQIAVGVLALVLASWWAVAPFLRWRTRTYTITNHRLITRRGIVHKSGRDIPLLRVHHVAYSRSLSDRIWRCGTLTVQTAAEGVIVLPDVPDVERVHLAMTELVFGWRGQQLPPSQSQPSRPATGRRPFRRGQHEPERPVAAQPPMAGGRPSGRWG